MKKDPMISKKNPVENKLVTGHLGFGHLQPRYSMDLAVLFYAWNTTMQFWLKKGHQNGQISKAIVISWASKYPTRRSMVQTL